MTQGFTKQLPLDTDGTLGANSDLVAASQKATKTYVDTEIDYITGTLQTSFRITPAASPGPPVAGAWTLGTLYMDSLGRKYRCISAGTPGTWVQTNLDRSVITVDAVAGVAKYTSLDTAMTTESAPGIIQVGPGSYTCAFHSISGWTIVGAGRGRTIVTQTASPASGECGIFKILDGDSDGDGYLQDMTLTLTVRNQVIPGGSCNGVAAVDNTSDTLKVYLTRVQITADCPSAVDGDNFYGIKGVSLTKKCEFVLTDVDVDFSAVPTEASGVPVFLWNDGTTRMYGGLLKGDPYYNVDIILSGADTRLVLIDTYVTNGATGISEGTLNTLKGRYIDGATKKMIYVDDSPFKVDGTTVVVNLNADLIDGYHGTDLASFAAQGRLTFTSGAPLAMATGTGKGTLYWSPLRGNRMRIYDGTNWQSYKVTEKSFAISGLAADTIYDVFLYNNAGTPALAVTAWTNHAARATGLVLQDGVYVKSGSTGYLFVGCIVTSVGSGNVCDDTATRPGVWNFFNQQKITVFKRDATAHSYATSAYRNWNNSATATFIQTLIGITQKVQVKGASVGYAGSVSNYNLTAIAREGSFVEYVHFSASSAYSSAFNEYQFSELGLTDFIMQEYGYAAPSPYYLHAMMSAEYLG